jgi:ABC-2 type transport system permease protein
LWLVGFELRIYWRGLFGVKGENPWPRIGLFCIVAVVGLGTGFLIASLLARADPIQAPDTLALILVSFALAVPASLMISQSIGAVINVAYTRADLALLFSSPVSPWVVTTSRVLGVVLNVALLYVALLLCVMAWAPFVGAVQWLGLIPAVLGIAMAATAIGILLALGLMRLVGPRRARVVSQVLAGLLGAGLFIGFQSFNFLPEEREEAAIAAALEWVRSLDTPAWNPLLLPARALIGPAWAQGLWFGLALVMLLGASWLFARVLPGFLAAVEGMATRPVRTAPGARAFQGGLMRTLVWKEWRLLARDPMLLFQIGLQLAYLVPLVVVMAINLGRSPETAAINALYGGLCVFLAAGLAGSLAWLTASAEDAPELIAASPVRRATIETGKLIAAVAPVALLLLTPAVLIGWTAPLAGLATFAAGACAACTAALIGVWYQKPGNRREFRRQRNTSFVAGFGQFVLGGSWSAVAGLTISGLVVWAAIPLILIAITIFVLEDGRPKGARDVAVVPQPATR